MKNKTKFTHAQNKVLTLIYRRLNYFHNGNLNETLMHLSYPSHTKAIRSFGLIKPHGKETPRVLNWYSLTEKGRLFFKHYVTMNRLSDEESLVIFNGGLVKTFDISLLNVKQRLEYLRQELRKECISYEELIELQSLGEHIEDGDVELLEAANFPEFKP